MKSKLLSGYAILIAIVMMVAVWLLIDAVLWVSGHQRYTILFERLFDTPVSQASRMRWIQGATACAFACVCIGALAVFSGRPPRRHVVGETGV